MNQENQEVDYKVDLSKPPVEKTEEVKEEKDNTQEEVVEENKDIESNDAIEEKADEVSGKEAEVVEEVEEQPEVSISKEDVIAEFLTNKYSLGIEELDNVLSNKEKKAQDLPEEVEKYLQYKSETKRGLKDFVKANEDFSEYEESTILREYYKQSNPELDDTDIAYLIEEKFAVEEGIDTQKDIKRKNLERKQELYKAKEFFKQTQEKYKAPLESSLEDLPENVKEAVEFYNKYNDDTQKEQETQLKQREVFQKKTSEVFSDKFEGFEFNIGEKTFSYKPKDLNKVAKNQSDLTNFINKFLDDNGYIKDAKKYHTALNMAMNPEAYAKFFYEQGKSDAVNEVVKDGKNIDMNVRSNVDSSKPGTKFRVLQDSGNFGSGLKIRKK